MYVFPTNEHCHSPDGRCSYPAPLRAGGWVGLDGGLHTKIGKTVYLLTVAHLSTNRARCRVTLWLLRSRRDQRVCLSVRSHISNPRTNTNNFSVHVPIAVARSSSDGNAIRYAFPVLRITSRFYITERMGSNQRTTRMFRPVRQVAPPGAKLLSAIAGLFRLWDFTSAVLGMTQARHGSTVPPRHCWMHSNR